MIHATMRYPNRKLIELNCINLSCALNKLQKLFLLPIQHCTKGAETARLLAGKVRNNHL